ncbi:MAG: magnesium transporter [Bilifractor sp.]
MSEIMETEELEERKEQIQKCVEAGDGKALNDMFEDMEAIDFAQIVESMEDDEIFGVMQLLNNDNRTALVEESSDEMRLRLAKTLDNHALLDLFSNMQKDDIVDMLGDFPTGRRKEVLDLMKADDRQIITNLLQYPEESAGGLMSTAYLALNENLTVSEGIHKIHEIGPKTEVIETIYVTDPMHRLTGTVDLRDLLSSPGPEQIRNIMHDNVIYVTPEVDQEEVAKLVSRYDLQAIPVVSARKQLLGIITVDDVIDVIIQEHDEDMLQMAGVSSEESLKTSLGQSVRFRLPWLLVNLATAFLASFTVKAFESTINKVVALSAIMTIVSGMGGNAGTQTMSVLVRELSHNKITVMEAVKGFFKEILLGIIDGAVNGVVTGVIVTLIYGNFYLGVIVFIAMIGNMIVAGVFGFLVPLLLDKIHADPAVASSIFVTTATDVLGFFIFLGLAKLTLPLLLGA